VRLSVSTASRAWSMTATFACGEAKRGDVHLSPRPPPRAGRRPPDWPVGLVRMGLEQHAHVDRPRLGAPPASRSSRRPSTNTSRAQHRCAAASSDRTASGPASGSTSTRTGAASPSVRVERPAAGDAHAGRAAPRTGQETAGEGVRPAGHAGSSEAAPPDVGVRANATSKEDGGGAGAVRRSRGRRVVGCKVARAGGA